MFAVIRAPGNHDITVSLEAKTVFKTELCACAVGDKLEFPVIALYEAGSSLQVATDLSPLPMKVIAEVLPSDPRNPDLGPCRRSRKILIIKHKPRHTYRRKKGHRQSFISLRVQDIVKES